MENPKTEVIQAIKDAQNVLVTVSQDPSIDQLAAAIGMTLVLNKLGKHGTAVFSGSAPSTIEFLKPAETLEKNTDSLRDFIISLDKSKADKLRYKVEDQHVKIFITPYRTTIGEDDLVFSHGDFNVDVVLALGVHEQNQLDQAITAHGRILHDAKIISVNVDKPGELGGVNLNEQASSLSELMAQISLTLKNDVFDEQTATAFLTGVVAETDRFSNEKTKPETMTISAKLMAAGANQQLVATQLEVTPEPEPAPVEAVDPQSNEDEATTDSALPKESKDSVKHDDGSLEIKHEEPKTEPESAPEAARPEQSAPEEKREESNDQEEQHPHAVHVDEHGNFKSSHNEDELPKIHSGPKARLEPLNSNKPRRDEERSRMILDPPANTGGLTPDGSTQGPDDTVDPLSLPPVNGKILNHGTTASSEDDQVSKQDNEAEQPDLPSPQDDSRESDEAQLAEQEREHDKQVFADQTLDSLERAVDSPHQKQEDSSADDVEPPKEELSLPEPPKPTEDPKPEDSEPQETEPKAEDTNAPDIDELQSAVDKALEGKGDQAPLEPIEALNANPIDLDLGHDEPQNEAPPAPEANDEYLDVTKLDVESGLQNNGAQASPEPPKPKFPPDPTPMPSTDASSPASPPPPVPPPMMPPQPSYNGDDDHQTLPPVPPL